MDDSSSAASLAARAASKPAHTPILGRMRPMLAAGRASAMCAGGMRFTDAPLDRDRLTIGCKARQHGPHPRQSAGGQSTPAPRCRCGCRPSRGTRRSPGPRACTPAAAPRARQRPGPRGQPNPGSPSISGTLERRARAALHSSVLRLTGHAAIRLSLAERHTQHFPGNKPEPSSGKQGSIVIMGCTHERAPCQTAACCGPCR
jgi:hypothetical protein